MIQNVAAFILGTLLFLGFLWLAAKAGMDL